MGKTQYRVQLVEATSDGNWASQCRDTVWPTREAAQAAIAADDTTKPDGYGGSCEVEIVEEFVEEEEQELGLPPGSGWCWGCHEAGFVEEGHFLCKAPQDGYRPGHLEDGGWTAIPDPEYRVPQHLPPGDGWCPDCHAAGRLLPQHGWCSHPRPGYTPGRLHRGGWSAIAEESRP